MNVHKALKVKNRLAGEVKRLQEIFARENSRRNDNPSNVNATEVYNQIEEVSERLVNLKGAIAKASAEIVTKLARMEEFKNQVNFIKGLDVREGEEILFIGRDQEKLIFNWKATINAEKRDLFVRDLETKINLLQDEVDEFNSKTKVDFAG
ncbi:MAG: hypothetical protein AABY22_28140 [Nanoarchaeota archaeon]